MVPGYCGESRDVHPERPELQPHVAGHTKVKDLERPLRSLANGAKRSYDAEILLRECTEAKN